MTWEWSVTSEAKSDLYENIHDQPHEWLRVVFAEWKASANGYFHPRVNARRDFDERRYQRALASCADMPEEVLADKIYDFAERLANATNGCHAAWCCPHGCGCHLLPFHRFSDDNED